MIQNILTKVHPNNFNTTKSINTSHSSLLKAATCDSISFKSKESDKDVVPQDAIQCLFNEIKALNGRLEIESEGKISFKIENYSNNSTLESSTITFQIKDLAQTTTGKGKLEKLAEGEYKITSIPTQYQQNMIENILNTFAETTGIDKEAIAKSDSPAEYMRNELAKLTELDEQKQKKAQKLITTYENQSNKFRNEQNNSTRIARDILSRYSKIAENKENLKTRLLDWFNKATMMDLTNLKSFLDKHTKDNCW